MTPRAGRPHDLVLLGATGVVGRLTAEHLARYAPPGLRVALAGRSTERLSAVRAGLGGTAAGWPLLPCDVTDPAAVAELAGLTRLVVTTVGPYLPRGLPLVQACARAGTDYTDLTGETLFVRRSIDAAHAEATTTGARIVHACGFDSVPSDLGVGLAAARAAAEDQGVLTEAVLHVRSMRGGVGGSTVDSLRQQLLEMRADAHARSLVGRSDALVDAPSPFVTRRPARRPRTVERDPETGSWQAPFVLGAFNAQVVRRSNALSGQRYGRDFRYREVVDTGTGPAGAAAAAGVAVGTAALTAGLWFGPTRAVLDRVLPEPGEAPRERTLARGRFRLEVLARTTTGARYRTTVAVDQDPAYHATAAMLAESALCLARDDLPTRGGVLTPMVALGEPLARRLRAHGFTLQTDRV